MSQEKVDRYKKEKANRRKNMKKEKIQYIIRRCIVGVLAVALVGWIGYSAVNMYMDSRRWRRPRWTTTPSQTTRRAF